MQDNPFINGDFIQACKDYFYLIDRKYPERGILKLTGDRYRLSGDQRTVMYRGISSFERSRLRSSLLVPAIKGKHLIIDGYNVLFSLLNYRLGRIVFISTDNVLRDAGSLHGKIRNMEYFTDCIELMMGSLSQLNPDLVDIYLDSPVSHSEKHVHLLKEKFAEKGLQGDCFLVRSADWSLKHVQDGVLATSDTVIIEKAAIKVFDLSRMILETAFTTSFLQLRNLVGLTDEAFSQSL